MAAGGPRRWSRRDPSPGLLSRVRRLSIYSPVDVAKGQELFQAGEYSTAVFRVEEGLLQLVASDRHGDEATLELVGPGGMIGELALVACTRTPHGAVALLPTSLTRVDAAPASRPHDLLPAVLAVLSSRVRVQQDAVLRDRRRHVLPRLASLLLDLAALSPGMNYSVPWIPHGLTQADLARVLASSRESVSRALGELERRGWIRRTPDRLLITANGPLRAEADDARRGPARETMVRNALERQRALAALLGLDDHAHGARGPTLYDAPLSA